MKDHRVTIKYINGKQTCVLSITVPATTERQAIEKIISAHGLDGRVISKKAELLKGN